MKKLIAISLLLALLAPAVFAQDEESGITFGGWGRANFLPLQVITEGEGDAEAKAGTGVDWDKYPFIEYAANGSNGKVGFQLQVVAKADGGDKVLGTDGAEIWAKLFDVVTLRAGEFNRFDLWGKIGGGSWGSYALGSGGEDSTFTGTYGKGSYDHFLISAAPVEGLFIQAMWAGPGGSEAETDIKDYYRKTLFGIGYTLPNIGEIRAQYVGNIDSYEPISKLSPGVVNDDGDNVSLFDKLTNDQRIEAAFAYTGIENLTIDAGIKFYIPVTGNDGVTQQGDADVKYSAYKPFQFNIAAKYVAGDFEIAGFVLTQIAGAAKVTYADGDEQKLAKPFGFSIRALPAYKLGDIGTVGGDINFKLDSQETYETTYQLNNTIGKVVYDESKLGFGVGGWFRFNLGQGEVQVGLGLKVEDLNHEEKTKTTFSVPVKLEFWF
jgi:hypothetical protein